MDDPNFAGEGAYQRSRFDKATGLVVDANEPSEKPEGDLFEAVDAGQGEQFMAVKPWIG